MFPVHALLPDTENLNKEASKLPLDTKKKEMSCSHMVSSGNFALKMESFLMPMLFYLYEKKSFLQQINNSIRHSTLNIDCTADNILPAVYLLTRTSYWYSTMQRILSCESCSAEKNQKHLAHLKGVSFWKHFKKELRSSGNIDFLTT